MKSNMTIALAADRWVHNRGRAVMADIAIRMHPNAGAALTRLQGDIDAAEPAVEIQEQPSFLASVKAAFNREDAASFHEPEMDHAEPHDTPGNRVPTPPGAGKVEEERADWDRQHDGDRFE